MPKLIPPVVVPGTLAGREQPAIVVDDRSRRVAVRAGFISEGIRRGSNLHEDGWHDMQMYSHLSTDAPGVVIGEPGAPADGPAAIAPEGL